MLTLGGRNFQVIESCTIEWDVTLLNLLTGCGLADVTMHAGEDAEGLAMRVFRTLMSSGAVFEILGCVLAPADSNALEWTPTEMKMTAAFLRKLHSDEDKAEINSQIVSLVTGFFQRGLLSVRTFPTSSTLLSAETETQPEPIQAANMIPFSANGPA